MALVKCKECGKEISTKADSCPNCGAKPKKKTSLLTWIVAIIFAFVLFGAILNGNHDGTASPPPRQKTAEEKERDRNLQRAAVGAKAIKESLRNPDSLQLASVIVMESGNICYEYRAQNGFGGMSVENAVLSADGSKFLSTSMDGFAPAWNAMCAGQRGEDISRLVKPYL